MRRRIEVELFGIAYVDLMCLAFVGQIIFWINQFETTPPKFTPTLVSIEGYGHSHFWETQKKLFILRGVSPDTDPPNPDWISNDEHVAQILTANVDQKIDNVQITSNFYRAENTDQSTGQQPIGPAASLHLSFGGIQNQSFEIWIPFKRYECRTPYLHPIEVSSVTSFKTIWAGVFTLNQDLMSAFYASSWQSVGAFLAQDHSNQIQTWPQLLTTHLFFTTPPQPAIEQAEEKGEPITTLWLRLRLNHNGIQKMTLIQQEPNQHNGRQADCLGPDDSRIKPPSERFQALQQGLLHPPS